MKSGKLVFVVIGAVVKIIVAIGAAYAIYQGATICYDYGYRVFTEPAVSLGTGRVVTVTVKKDATPMELGDLFEKKGLVRDAKLFALQYLLSEYRKDLIPGTYDLNTAMTAEEMLEVMATPAPAVPETTESTATKPGEANRTTPASAQAAPKK